MAIEHIEPKRASGQALFEIANLRPERTGLPFVVFISQRGGARHDVRVKIARSAKVRPSEMMTIAVRPRPRIVEGKVDAHEFEQLRRWIALNEEVLIKYWDSAIEYTEDALDALKRLPPDPAER